MNGELKREVMKQERKTKSELICQEEKKNLVLDDLV